MTHFHIISLFPESMESYLASSIIKRAIEDKKIKVSFYNPRDFIRLPKAKRANPSRADLRVDDRPYGGGPGMVIQAEPVIRAIAKALGKSDRGSKKSSIKHVSKNKIIWLSPSGKQFDNSTAKVLASKYDNIVIICGRYEGIDARVKKIFKTESVSAGPFVLTGGELPALIIMDAVSRQVPGVLGDFNSIEEGRVASPDVYTRPVSFKYKNKKLSVPAILISGNHKAIEKWRLDKKHV